MGGAYPNPWYLDTCKPPVGETGGWLCLMRRLVVWDGRGLGPSDSGTAGEYSTTIFETRWRCLGENRERKRKKDKKQEKRRNRMRKGIGWGGFRQLDVVLILPTWVSTLQILATPPHSISAWSFPFGHDAPAIERSKEFVSNGKNSTPLYMRIF